MIKSIYCTSFVQYLQYINPIIPGPVRPGRGQLAGGGPLHARAQPLQPAALRRGGRGCRQVGLASQPLPLLRF